MLKIALSGKAGSGKNTVANIISDYFALKPHETYIYAFANPIKKIIEVAFPECDLESLYGNSELRQKNIICDINRYYISTELPTYRQAAVDLGKWGRKYSPRFWIWHAMRAYDLNKGNKLFIISDLRFPEEYEWVKSENFVLCRLKRNNSHKIDDISEHIQDQLPDNLFDFVIENNSSLDVLKTQIHEMIRNMCP